MKLLNGLFYSFSSNLIGFLISAAITLIVPKMTGLEVYGIFQLYLFYIGYISIFSFGWCDGLYLNYGGLYYKDIDKKSFATQLYIFVLLEVIIGSFIIIAGSILSVANYNKYIYVTVGLCTIIHLPKAMLLNVLQATNRIKEYAKVTITEKVSFFLLAIITVIFRPDDYKSLIFSDLIGKICGLAYGVYICKEICFNYMNPLWTTLREIFCNIKDGSKLLISNLASMMIIGIVRWGIQKQWGIKVFGNISLTMSVSNLLMILIRSASMIMFPVLRRMNIDNIKSLYSILSNNLMILFFGLMNLYYPISFLLNKWLPQYREGLQYMAILFPICIFEGKNSLLIETYLKVLRKENILLAANLLTVLLSVFSTFLSVFIVGSVNLALISIVVLIGFKSIFSEIILYKTFSKINKYNILLEAAMVSIFIFSNSYIGGAGGGFIYLCVYLVYLYIKKDDLIRFVKNYFNN